MGDVAQAVGITPRTIRHYEHMGLLPRAKRSSGRVRLFDESDVTLIKKIRHMHKVERISLEQIRLDLYGNPSGNIALITDQSANMNEGAYEFLKVIEINIDDTDDQIIQSFVRTYQEAFDSGMDYIFSIHTGEPHSQVASLAQVAANQFQNSSQIVILDIPILGSVLGLLGHVMGDHIQTHCLVNELKKLVLEVLPYMGMIFTLSSINPLYEQKLPSTKFTNSLRDSLGAVMPVFMQSTRYEQMPIKGFVGQHEDQVDALVEIFEKELSKRDRFLSFVAITHYNELEKAMRLSDMLQDRHIKVPILILSERPERKSVLGDQFLGISFV